jgi:hypothetical protein
VELELAVLRELLDLLGLLIRDADDLETVLPLLGELRQDRDIVFAEVSNCGEAIRFAAPRWKDDPSIVEAAVRQSGKAMSEVGPKVRHDRQILRLAAQAGSLDWYIVDNSIYGDVAFVRELVALDPSLYSSIGVELRKDQSAHFAAAQGMLLRFAPKECCGKIPTYCHWLFTKWIGPRICRRRIFGQVHVLWP